MTDNTIGFNAGQNADDTSFGFQIQPVYAIPNKSQWNMIARAVVPIVVYLLKSMPGAYIAYNNSITYDWSADSDALTVPLGLTFGKSIVKQNGDFWDLSVGAYPLVVRPDGAPSWQLKLGISYFFD